MTSQNWLELAANGNLEELKEFYLKLTDKQQITGSRDKNGDNALSLALKNAKVPTQVLDNEKNSLLHITAIGIKNKGEPKEEDFRSWKEYYFQNQQKLYKERQEKYQQKQMGNQFISPEEQTNAYFQDTTYVIFQYLLNQARVHPLMQNNQGQTVIDLVADLPSVKQQIENFTKEKEAKVRLVLNLPTNLFRMIVEYL